MHAHFVIVPREVISAPSRWRQELSLASLILTDAWANHFFLDEVQIVPLSDIGDVTVRILDFNSPDRLLERKTLQAISRYPTSAALLRIGT